MKMSMTVAVFAGALSMACVPMLAYASDDAPEPYSAPNPSDAGVSSGMSKGGAMQGGAMKSGAMKGGAMKSGAMKGTAMKGGMMKKKP